MIIQKLIDVTQADIFGGKAVKLGDMLRCHLPVPEGIAIGNTLLSSWQEITKLPIEQLQNTVFPEQLLTEILLSLDEHKIYAVRSSAINEDTTINSFAGIYTTELYVQGKIALQEAIKKVLLSEFSPQAIAYMKEQNQSQYSGMGIIIQEQIIGEKSGVAFSINPLTAADTQILIEAIAGECYQLVDGKVTPNRYMYDWQHDTLQMQGEVLTEKQCRQVAMLALTLQIQQGYPLDIEYTFVDETCYLLQMRPITAIKFNEEQAEWTNANFKDGGVSATVCPPFMYSLYELIWEPAFRRYFDYLRVKYDPSITPYLRYQFGKVYWNISIIKDVMKQIPGFQERDFDDELGVTIAYEGTGQTSKLSLATLIRLPFIVKGQLNAKQMQQHLLEVEYPILKERVAELFQQPLDKQTISHATWQDVIFELYKNIETLYFTQVYINTVEISLFKKFIRKYVSTNEMYLLLGGLENVSHTRLITALWGLRADLLQIDSAPNPNFLLWKAWFIKQEQYQEQFATILTAYGYHSLKELDVRVPSFSEDKDALLKLLHGLLFQTEQANPQRRLMESQTKVTAILETIKQKVSTRVFAKIQVRLTKMKKLLWWREELKDLSTYCYAVIRKYTMALAQRLVEEKLINEIDDIWLLTVTEINTLPQPATLFHKRKQYLASFQSFHAPNELGYRHTFKQNLGQALLQGVGCSSGIIEGRVRIVTSYDMLDLLIDDEIIVTKYTDTGWLSKFASLRGLITEHGGVLSHAAVIAREFNLPTIVAATNATKMLKDGQKITMNAATGEIFVLDN